MDFQSLYPASLVPSFLSALPPFYVQMSGDPLIAAVMGYLGPNATAQYVWLKSFMVLELCVHIF
jgi:hypothetical protein